MGGDPVLSLGLIVHCDSPGALAEVAGLLAVPVVVDPGSDPSGRRCQRATRTFGRVFIQAYAETPTGDR